MNPRRTDRNHSEIVRGCRAMAGVSVFDTHTIGGGFPDIVVGYQGNNYLFEIKDGAKPRSGRKLTPKEIEFCRDWRGQVAVVFTIADIAKIINHHAPLRTIDR